MSLKQAFTDDVVSLDEFLEGLLDHHVKSNLFKEDLQMGLKFQESLEEQKASFANKLSL